MKEILHQCYKFGFEVSYSVTTEPEIKENLSSHHHNLSVSQRAGQTDDGMELQADLGQWGHQLLYAVDEVGWRW